jgi:hypothetical protein
VLIDSRQIVAVHDIKWMQASCRRREIMTPDKSKTMDAAEKLMLDLMEKHPGASESSLLALFQNVARERPEVLRTIVGNFMKHSLVQ